MLEVNNLTFRYPKKDSPTLFELSFKLQPGGVYGLLGLNGAGKSTLLYLIAGLLTPQQGSVTYNGIDTRLRLPATLDDIFIVPEEFDLPNMTLAEFVELYSVFYPRFSYDDMTRHLATFDLPSNIDLATLSMGQKKKAYMCFALACNTSLMLMDEPTNGLDIPGKTAFRRFIASSMNDERTIIISTHQVRDINLLIDHVLILHDNAILLNSSMGAISEKLCFATTTDPERIAKALYAAPGMLGATAIFPNTDGAETDVDLESLFEFAIAQPQWLKSVFDGTYSSNPANANGHE